MEEQTQCRVKWISSWHLHAPSWPPDFSNYMWISGRTPFTPMTFVLHAVTFDSFPDLFLNSNSSLSSFPVISFDTFGRLKPDFCHLNHQLFACFLWHLLVPSGWHLQHLEVRQWRRQMFTGCTHLFWTLPVRGGVLFVTLHDWTFGTSVTFRAWK